MPRLENQKLKLYHTIEIFKRMTDEEHPVTVSEIIELLAEKGIAAERKSVYRDMEAMKQLGYDIISIHEKQFRYYLAEREFETVELRMLIDAVQASRFITKRKSNELIRKLETLTTVHNADKLHSQVFVTNRIKSSNESIYYNVDSIHNAINADSQIRFRYFDWDISKERKYRRDNKYYEVSPWSLIWNNENYYLIAYCSDENMIKHFRVDRMTNIIVSGKAREGKGMFSGIDVAQYASRFFGMYDGELTSVTLRCDKSVTNAVVDRFGTDIIFKPNKDNESFDVTVKVAISPVFLSWVFMFDGLIKVIDPKSVNDELKNMAKRLV